MYHNSIVNDLRLLSNVSSTCFLVLQELSYGAVGWVCHVLELLYQTLLKD